MQAPEYDAIVVGSGISGGWAAKELTEKGLRVLLLERGRNVEHIKDYVNATKAPWQYAHRGGRTQAMEEPYPVLKRDYPLNEKNLAFWARRGVAVHRGQAVRLVPRLPGRRTLAPVGAPELPAQRLRLRGQRAGRHRHRLAHSLRRPRTLVRSRRAITRGSPARIEGLPQLPDGAVPAGHAAQLRRGARRRPPDEAVRRAPAHHPGPHRERHPAAPRPRRLPVPRRLLARLPVRRATSARSRPRCRPP